MPLFDQILAVTKRSFLAYWRLPDYAMVCLPSLRPCYPLIRTNFGLL